MRVLRKKTANLLRVDNNFASLLDIEGDSTFVYEFQYFAAVVDTLRAGASTVRISIRTEPPLPEREIFERIDDEGDSGRLIDDILLFEAKRKDGRRNNKLNVTSRVNSDLTAKFNNEATRVVDRNEISADAIISPIRVIDPQPLVAINDENVDPPVMQVMNVPPPQAQRDPQNSALGLIFNAGVDPSVAGTRVSRYNGTHSSFNGTTTSFNGTSDVDRIESSSPNTRIASDNLIESLVGPLIDAGLDTLKSTDLGRETLIPRVVDVPRTMIRNTEMMRISRDIVGGSDFFAVFELLDADGTVLETISERVRHGALSRIFSTPRVPPRVAVAPFQFPGRNIVEIEQRDRMGRKIRVFRRSLRRTDTRIIESQYQQIAEISLRSVDGLYKFTDVTNNAHVNLYRCVTIGPGGLIGAEFSNVVAPAQVQGEESVCGRSNVATITAKTVREGVEVAVQEVAPNVVSATLLRRDVTLHETDFEFLSDPRPIKLVHSGLHAATFIDKDTRNNHIYEYKCKLYFDDGLVVDSTAYALHKYVPVSIGIVTVDIDDLQVTRNGSVLDVSFAVSVQLTEGNLDFVKSALAKQGLLDIYEDELGIERDKLQKLIAYNIERVNMSTGEVENFGTVTDDVFYDSKLGEERGVRPLRDNTNYTYKVTALLRDAETMFDEFRKTSKDERSGKEYTYDASKFRHPLSLVDGTLTDRDSRRRNHAEDDFAFGRVGVTREVPVILGTPPLRVREVDVKRVDKKTVAVKWRVDGNVKQVEHFIVAKELLGMKSIVGKVNHVTVSNTYEFFDTLTPDDIGEIRYYVTPVLNDYSRGITAKSVALVIRDGRI